ncbi:MAG: hypothetical protein KDI68_04670 [Gammaproteobacteria bacterium]|nr:hypothetical protein [Gammaproteobacteria bacterium]
MFSWVSMVLMLVAGGMAHVFETVRVGAGILALIGELGQRSAANPEQNMTSGFPAGHW